MSLLRNTHGGTESIAEIEDCSTLIERTTYQNNWIYPSAIAKNGSFLRYHLNYYGQADTEKVIAL